MLRQAILLLLASFSTLRAQPIKKCGSIDLLQKIHEKNPSFRLSGHFESSTFKSTSSDTPQIIPVIFHIVLDLEQVKELGGREGIRKRVLAQLEVINRDLSAQNEIGTIPRDFAQVLGNPGIQLGLAQRNIFGYGTEGFHIKFTKQKEFRSNGSFGSGLGFSDAKYFTTQGDQAWDPTSYLNIWVINARSEQGEDILGLTMPPSYVNSNLGIPLSEQGIVLHYKAFGVQENGDEAYLPNATGGRTLTHELGHFFGLKHIWGDDAGLCPDNGGSDDGLEDTPPQGDATVYCPEYPAYDDCSNNGDGIMYMNFMDYTPDQCVCMFTNAQASIMRNNILPGGESYSLTQHPKLLEKPLTLNDVADFEVFPNPAHESINIYFQETPRDLKNICITDVSGRKLMETETRDPLATYTFDTHLLAPGLYYVICDLEDERRSKCITVIH